MTDPQATATKILAQRLEARLNDARFAFGKLEEAKKRKKDEIASIAEKVGAASSAIELLLREDHDPRTPQSVLDECTKLQKRVDKYTALKKSREEWHKGEIGKRQETLAMILSQGADQLPLLLPEVSVVSDVHVDGTLLVPHDYVWCKGVDNVVFEVVGFKTVGEGDERREVVVVRDPDGHESEADVDDLTRAEDPGPPKEDVEQLDPKIFGGFCVGDEVHHNETGEVGHVKGYSAGSKRVRVRWQAVPTPFDEDVDPNLLTLDKKGQPANDARMPPPKKKKHLALKNGDRVIVPDGRAGLVVEIVAFEQATQPNGKKRKVVSSVSVKIDGLKTAKTFEVSELKREPKART